MRNMADTQNIVRTQVDIISKGARGTVGNARDVLKAQSLCAAKSGFMGISFGAGSEGMCNICSTCAQFYVICFISSFHYRYTWCCRARLHAPNG